MTADDFFAKLKAVPCVPTDVDGNPIEELAGSMLKPLDCVDMMAVQAYVDKHGSGAAYLIFLARGIRRPDGSQIVPDERAGELENCLNAPMKRAVDKIRQLSGYSDKEEKKTSLKTGPSSPTSSASPGT